MKVKMSRWNFIQFTEIIMTVKEPDDADWKVQFTNALSKTKRLTKGDIESITEALDKKLKKVRESKELLDIEMCQVKEGFDVIKDKSKALQPFLGEEDKQPRFLVLFKVIYFQMYILLDEFTEEQYETRLREMIEEHQSEMDEIQKFMDEDITIDVHTVKCEFVPKMKQAEHDFISYMIED